MYMVFDSEFSSRGIYQACVILRDGAREVLRRVWNIRVSNHKQGDEVLEASGITPEQLDHPDRVSERQFVLELRDALALCGKVVAYNPGNDIAQIRASFMRQRITMPAYQIWDYFGWVRSRVDLPNMGQEYVARDQGIDVGNAHDAEWDTNTLCLLIDKLGMPEYPDYRKVPGYNPEAMELKGRPQDLPSILKGFFRYSNGRLIPLDLVGGNSKVFYSYDWGVLKTFCYDKIWDGDGRVTASQIKMALIEHFRKGGNYIQDTRNGGVWMKRAA